MIEIKNTSKEYLTVINSENKLIIVPGKTGRLNRNDLGGDKGCRLKLSEVYPGEPMEY